MSTLERGKTRIKGFDHGEMEFQLLRQLGSCNYGGASVGECLAAATAIVDGDPSSWVAAFTKLAQHQEHDARNRAAKGHIISARDQFLKASNTYRAAEYYTYSGESKHRDLGIKSRECFREAMNGMTHTFESFLLPYKNIQLPVYFMTPNAEAGKRKTLLIVSGYDGTMEEEYLMRGKAALERGMNVVLFAGPGQMDVFRDYPDTHFEPDFEHPVKDVIDFCASRPEIDMEGLAFLGISFGGYFATRATAFEKRITALIANSPIVNLHHYLAAVVDRDPDAIKEEENFCLEDIPDIPEKWMSKHDKIMAANLIKRFGQSTLWDTFDYLREFTVEQALDRIHCPCLAMVGSGEGEEPKRQCSFFSENVSGPIDVYVFTEFEGADAHCQSGNVSFASSVFLDWLEERLSR